jgi:hypothetical protein
MFDRLNSLVDQLIDQHHTSVEQRAELLKVAATLILAEEIHKLSTSNVSLAQAQTDLATALTNLSAVITQAVTDLQSDNPAVVQAAANNIEAAAGQLNTLATTLSAADPQPVSVPAGSPAAVGVTAKTS